jgi:hypothetical protein
MTSSLSIGSKTENDTLSEFTNQNYLIWDAAGST